MHVERFKSVVQQRTKLTFQMTSQFLSHGLLNFLDQEKKEDGINSALFVFLFLNERTFFFFLAMNFVSMG